MGATAEGVVAADTDLSIDRLTAIVESRLARRLRALAWATGQWLDDVTAEAVSVAWELASEWDPEQSTLEQRVVFGVGKWIINEFRASYARRTVPVSPDIFDADPADHTRHRDRDLESSVAAARATQPDTLHRLAASDQWLQVMHAIMDLSPLMRAALLMRDDAITDRHIAVLFDRQESAVRMARKAARERLARMGFSPEV